jgi:chromosome segregation ATPase
MAEEENLKLKFLDLEKKFVELEMNVSKINESLKKLEATKLNEVLERFEEIEDLVMIENAAVVELKELLEASNTDEIRKDLEAVKKDFEEKINNINSTLSSSLSEIRENIAKISSDTEKIKELEQRIEKVESSLAFIPKIIEEGDLIEGLGKIVKTHDETIESIKRELDEIKGLKDKIEEELNKRIPSSLLEDFVKLGNELSLLKVNVSSLSKQLDEIYRDVKLLKPEMIREAISKMTELKVETEERVKEVNDLIASISSQKEDIKKIGLIEARINDVSKQINSFLAEIEFLKSSISNFSTKKELEKLKEEMSGIVSTLDSMKNQLVIKEDWEKFEKEISSLREDLSNMKSEVNKSNLEIDIIRNSLQAISSKIEERKDILTQKDIENISRKFVNVEDFSALLIDFKRLQQEFDKSKHDLMNSASRDEIQSLMKEVSALRGEIEGIKKEIIQPTIIQQIANKITLLEAKIGEMEKRLETKIKPIILE